MSAIISKKLVILLLKLLVAGGFLCWLHFGGWLDFSLFFKLPLNGRSLALMVIACGGVLAGQYLMALRIRLLLLKSRFFVPIGQAFAVTLMSSFFGVALPGLIGGDAVKATYFCSNVQSRRLDTLTAVLADRVLGLYSLIFLGAVMGILGMFNEQAIIPRIVLWAGPILALVLGAGLALAAWPGLYRIKLLDSLLRRLPSVILRIIEVFRSYLNSPSLLVAVLTLSILNHALVVLSFVCAAKLLGDQVSWFTGFTLNPLAMLCNILPLTPGGLGVTEGAFAYLYLAVGSANGAEIGLLGRMLQYVVFIGGGVIALFFLKVKNKMLSLSDGHMNRSYPSE